MNKAALAIIAVFAIAYVAPLGVRPMVMPDETRYGEIPREMIESGNWVAPRLDGLHYYEKPVFGYWLNALSIMILGENAFAVRLPAALSAGLSALLIFLLARRFAGGPTAGILSAAILLSCFLPFAIGVFSVLDSQLSSFLTGTMVCFFFAYKETRAARKMLYLAACGVFCGLAFLTKGFLAFMVPVVVVVPFLAWERQWKDFLRLPWIPMLAALLVALPWSIAIHLQDNDFWRYFFFEEHIARALNPSGGQHPEPFWFFIPIFMAGALPWLLLLPAAVRKAGRIDRTSLLRFAICWFIFPFIGFSMSSGKLGTYILPCFPPFAALTAVALIAYFARGAKRLFNAGAILCAVMLGLIATTLLVAQVTSVFSELLIKVGGGPHPYANGETWKAAVCIGALVAAIVLVIIAACASNMHRKLTCFALSPVIVMFAMHFIVPAAASEGKAPGEFLMMHAEEVDPNSILVSNNYMAPGVCWFFKRTDVYIAGGGGELTYGLKRADDERLLSPDQFAELIRENAGKRKILYFTHHIEPEMAAALPQPAAQMESHGFTFVRY